MFMGDSLNRNQWESQVLWKVRAKEVWICVVTSSQVDPEFGPAIFYSSVLLLSIA
jgi:hypothetical protein